MTTKHGIAALVLGTAVAGLLMGPPLAGAQTETTSTPASRGAPDGADKWHFSIPLGVWPFGIQGPVAVAGYQTDVDMSIHDVQELTDRALGFAFEAGRGKTTALGQVAFLRFEPDPAYAMLPNGVTVFGSPRLDWITAEFAGSYRAAVLNPGPRMLVLEPLLGVRYTRMESSIQLQQPADTALAEHTVDWFDGFVGLRGVKMFSEHVGLSFRGDIGTGGTNMAWTAAGMLGYRFPIGNAALTVAAGYKGAGMDYGSKDTGKLYIDQTMAGPTLGLAYSF